MKKILIMLSALVMSMSFTSAMAEQLNIEDPTVGLIINEQWASADQPPVLENGRTLAPIRIVSELLGFDIDWEAETEKITISKADTTITMHIGSKILTKNGKQTETDVAPAILNQRTIIPVRVVAELLDCTVEWHEKSYTVFINSPEAYAYYNSLSDERKTYDDSYTQINGYLGYYIIEPDYIVSGMPLEKYYIIPDGICNVVADDGYGNKNTFINIKKIELDLSDAGDNYKTLIGKRVSLTGCIKGVANRANSMPFRFFANSIKEDSITPLKTNYATAFKNVLNTATHFGEEIKWAKLIDINKDGINEMIVLELTESMNYADLSLYSFTPNGITKETVSIGNYSQSGNFKEGPFNIYEYNSYVIIENSINGVGTNSEGEEYSKGSSFNRFSVNADGSLKYEIAYYDIAEGTVYVKGYNETEPKVSSQAEADIMIAENTNGTLTNILKIVPDYSYGVAYAEINESFFDTKSEVEAQLQ